MTQPISDEALSWLEKRTAAYVMIGSSSIQVPCDDALALFSRLHAAEARVKELEAEVEETRQNGLDRSWSEP